MTLAVTALEAVVACRAVSASGPDSAQSELFFSAMATASLGVKAVGRSAGMWPTIQTWGLPEIC